MTAKWKIGYNKNILVKIKNFVFKYIGQNGSSIYGILKENDNQIKLCKLKQL